LQIKRSGGSQNGQFITSDTFIQTYAGGVTAVSDFCLEIQDKEFIVLVGPSGCGKSTTLRMIAGLEEISDGEVYIGDRLVNDVAPKDRDIAMVFQNYALYPHMTVYRQHGFRTQAPQDPEGRDQAPRR
jgi:multiple sugar transport system ATP-binding protein